MRGTPETDAYAKADWWTLFRATEHGRILERERDEARTELEMWRDGNIMHQVHKDELEKAERERNEARDMVENLTDHGLTLMDSNRMLKRERDEAREALREIQAADWKTAGELRGMARKVLEAAK
jgi:hypothetical protein